MAAPAAVTRQQSASRNDKHFMESKNLTISIGISGQRVSVYRKAEQAAGIPLELQLLHDLVHFGTWSCGLTQCFHDTANFNYGLENTGKRDSGRQAVMSDGGQTHGGNAAAIGRVSGARSGSLRRSFASGHPVFWRPGRWYFHPVLSPNTQWLCRD